jgi:DNA helicase-2/ATP-dependent DNA helicase PcrA
MSTHITHASAGSGKTESAIKTFAKLLADGKRPEEIIFVCYTKAASQEALQRIQERFGFEKKRLPYVSTIHSICYKKFCLDKKVISQKQIKEFFDLNHIDYEVVRPAGDDTPTGEFNSKIAGNILLSFYNILRTNLCKSMDEFKNEQELKKAFLHLKEHSMDFSSVFVGTFNPFKILTEYEAFKRERNLCDYDDMLMYAYKDGYTIPDASILFADEYQDINLLEKRILDLFSKDKDEVYIFADMNQTIYAFNGASADFLLDEIKKLDETKGDELIFLPKTYRMSSVINDFCFKYIQKNIRKEKQLNHMAESHKKGGEVIKEDIGGELVRTLEFIRPGIPTFILLRTNYYKHLLIDEVLIPNGILYKEIRGQSLWNQNNIDLFNAIVNLVEHKPLNASQASILFESIPFKLGLLKRGAKSQFKTKDKKEEYTLDDLLLNGFNETIKKFLTYEDMFGILDISTKVKLAFESKSKEIISGMITLEVGTLHSAKGLGRTDVLVFATVPQRIVKDMARSQNAFESEIRVFYVGYSRARERLVILRGGFRHGDSSIIP